MAKVDFEPVDGDRRSDSTSPALLTRTWMRGVPVEQLGCAPPAPRLRSARSNTTRSTWSERLARRMSETARPPRSSLRAVITVWAPARARATAVALPTPELPPVITTVLPSIGTGHRRHRSGGHGVRV